MDRSIKYSGFVDLLNKSNTEILHLAETIQRPTDTKLVEQTRLEQTDVSTQGPKCLADARQDD